MVVVGAGFEQAWNRWLQSKMEGTVWTMSNNYFKSPTGHVLYRVLIKVLGRVSETTTSRPDPRHVA